MTLEECTTVEEVEAIECKTCSKTGHWGWCDTSWIRCSYKSRIKEILRQTESTITNINQHISDILAQTGGSNAGQNT